MPDTSSTQQVIASLRQGQSRIPSVVNAILYQTASAWLSILQSKAPVHKGTFRSSWTLRRLQSSTNETGVIIRNLAPHAVYIEGGGTYGRPPWPRETKKIVQKTFEDAPGDMWSRKAVGGTMRRLLTKKAVNAVAQDISKAVIGAFK